jgi:hypothetical protein
MYLVMGIEDVGSWTILLIAVLLGTQFKQLHAGAEKAIKWGWICTIFTTSAGKL